VPKGTDLAQGQRLRWQGQKRETIVLTTIVIVLLALWLLGFATAYTAGGLIHILLVVAVVVVLIRVLQGRNVMRG
jgi:hypothetical protein